MRNDKNHKTDQPCAFGETLVAVLYDEATALEKAEFEKHLQNCRVCGEEFATFGTLRSAVVEWRETEFAPLALPHIVLPAEIQTIETGANGKRAWLESLRALFTPVNFGWQFAAAGFAVFVILGLFFIGTTVFFKPNDETARTPNAATNPTPEVAAVQKTEKSRNEPAVSQSAPPENVSGQIGEKTSSGSTRVARKAPKQSGISPARGANSRKRAAPVQPNIEPKDADLSILPVADAEEESLRLTDLFEEIEPST